MIEHMGGTVNVRSTVNVGTVFEIDISTKSLKSHAPSDNQSSFVNLEEIKEEIEQEERPQKELTCVIANDDSF